MPALMLLVSLQTASSHRICSFETRSVPQRRLRRWQAGFITLSITRSGLDEEKLRHGLDQSSHKAAKTGWRRAFLEAEPQSPKEEETTSIEARVERYAVNGTVATFVVRATSGPTSGRSA